MPATPPNCVAHPRNYLQMLLKSWIMDAHQTKMEKIEAARLSLLELTLSCSSPADFIFRCIHECCTYASKFFHRANMLVCSDRRRSLRALFTSNSCCNLESFTVWLSSTLPVKTSAMDEVCAAPSVKGRYAHNYLIITSLTCAAPSVKGRYAHNYLIITSLT